MKPFACVLLLALTLLPGALRAEDPPAGMPEPPKPTAEHRWLEQLVGEWDTHTKATMGPDQPPIEMKGTESSRMVGGHFATFEHRGEAFGQPFTGILTIGYDAEAKRYIATWIDSMNPTMWRYEGTVDASGKKLTLETEGPCPESKTGRAKFRETIEVKGPDLKTFTSTREVDGEYVEFMQITFTRKKK